MGCQKMNKGMQPSDLRMLIRATLALWRLNKPLSKKQMQRCVENIEYVVNNDKSYTIAREETDRHERILRTMARPDYVKCVMRDLQTWCGRAAMPGEWCFCTPTHAALNGLQEGRLVCCPECADAIYKALKGDK
jgi:hypothetical protein